MENTLTREKRVTFSYVDASLRWRPHDMLAFMQDAADDHSAALGCGYEELHKKKQAWILCRMKLDVLSWPHLDDVVTVRTWPGPVKKCIFPRFYTIEDEQGTPLVKAVAIWLVFDTVTRKMADPQQVKLYREDLTYLSGHMPLPEKLHFQGEYQNSVTRTPVYSEIDANRHLNNTQYLKWICDLFDYRRYQLNTIKSVQINYINEIRPGGPITIKWSDENPANYILATGEDGTAHFEACVEWNESI